MDFWISRQLHPFEYYLLKLYVEEALSDKGEVFSRAYELKEIQKIADATDSVLSLSEGLTDEASASTSIAKLHEVVKAYDKDFQPRPISPELLNKDGTPKILYHGIKEQFTIYVRDGYRCRICGRTNRFDNLEIDHIKPIAKGGKSTYDNLQTHFRRCNKEKGDTYYRWDI